MELSLLKLSSSLLLPFVFASSDLLVLLLWLVLPCVQLRLMLFLSMIPLTGCCCCCTERLNLTGLLSCLYGVQYSTDKCLFSFGRVKSRAKKNTWNKLPNESRNHRCFNNCLCLIQCHVVIVNNAVCIVGRLDYITGVEEILIRSIFPIKYCFL